MIFQMMSNINYSPGLAAAPSDDTQVFTMRRSQMVFEWTDCILNEYSTAEHPNIPQRTGKVNNIQKFDSEFFGLHFEDPHVMDPMGRMLLEHTYEAIIDAGVNPSKLRGTNTGVFISNSISESEQELIYGTSQVGGSGVLGCSRGILANRISYWLGVTGPSYNVDSACSASLFAMDHAYRAIRTGQCDAALVGASQLCLNPFMSMEFSMLGVASPDGHCRSFDADANGYCRSEAICVIYLQKSRDAKRIYANVIYSKTNCDGFTEDGITFPSSAMQGALLQQFYEECKVPPTSLAFLEAHGTATRVGDLVELSTLERVLCPARTTPLRIGSVKSNLGHTEPASGACSIAKVLIAMESGLIPPNLHYNRPREGIAALMDGRIEVITELTPWDGGYVGINSFGFGGANAHILLKSNPKDKINNCEPNDDLPRLVVVSGRTKEAVTTLLDDLESRPVDVEYVSLFHNIHVEEIPGHLYRGYTILPTEGSLKKSVRDVQHYRRGKRPVWFVFPGIRYPWAGTRRSMGEALLNIPIFVKATQKCDAALKPHGVDIIDILTTKDPEIFTKISNWFVGIAVVQIGLVDILASIEIVPDNIIGHSIGELGCAYADGCLTAEQIVLAAYYHGLALTETESIPQSMAFVECTDLAPKTLYPTGFENAFDDNPMSSTIDGASDSIPKFTTKPQANDILAEGEFCSEVDNHSRYIAAAVSEEFNQFQRFIPDPLPRGREWLKNVSRSKWKTTSAGFFSPGYYTKSTVLFDEMIHDVPKNAIIIEIAPHGTLRTISRKSWNDTVTRNTSADYESDESVKLLLQAIGKMYELGLHPRLANLYPDVEHPVSRGTPMISPLVRWEHTKDWFVQKYTTQKKIGSGERLVHITLFDDAFEWIVGYVIDGRNLVPAAGYLVLVWETVALMQGKLYDEVSVVFEDVRFHRTSAIPKQDGVKLMIMVQKGSGRFEVAEGNTPVATGLIRVAPNPAQECIATRISSNFDKSLDLTDRDIYKELRLRGYQYTGLFRGLKGASLKGTEGSIAWKSNWVAFMDNMFQLKILGMDTRELFVPTGIQKLVINTKVHFMQLRTMPDGNEAFPVEVRKDLGIIVSGGVEIRGLRARAIARKQPAKDPVLEDFKFIVHRDRALMELSVATRIATHIVLENHLDDKMKTIELVSDIDDLTPENLTSPLVQGVLSDSPLVQANIIIIAPINTISAGALPSTIQIFEPSKLAVENDALLVMSHGILANRDIQTLKKLQRATKNAGFLLAREPLNADTDIFSTVQSENFDVIFERRTDRELVLLLRKRPKLSEIFTVIQINDHEFSWLSALQAALKAGSGNGKLESNRILLVSEGDSGSGLMGLVNCLRREPGGQVIQGLLIQDLQAPKFSLENPLYSDQLALGLTLNVLRPERLWGSYRFLARESLPLKPVFHFKISQLIHGDLSSLRWVEGQIAPNIRHRNMIEVHYSSINFRDVMISTGKLAVEVYAKTRMSQQDVIGMEFSGIDVNGRAVIGMISGGALSNFCICDTELLWPVPDNWTLEDAATIPVAYATAYYALMINGQMKKGDKVLIHAGTGGVGQAAINLALHEGCEVFTTVGTLEKRRFIRNQFPQIRDDHIGNSRDTSFEQLVFRKTQGKGVDIVLNSLAEEKLQASIRCLRKGGRFLEIGKFDLAENSPLGLEVFLKGIIFQGVHLDNLFTTWSEKKTTLVAMLAEGLKSGAVKPLVRTVFTIDQVEMAFRYMAAGKHIGKVVFKIRDETEVLQSPLPRGLPRYYCSEDCSYLILGGLGGFGLELADWLVLRGAKKLVLTSRKGITTGYQRFRINIWQSYGVEIVVIVGKDGSTDEGCRHILEKAAAIGPVDAIFNLAVVLKDSLCEDQTVQSFEECFRVKAWTTKQLDKLSRTLCPHLRQFVVFSSVTSGRGNAGQTNYGMSNSVMERICESRAKENLPGLAIQWGVIGDVGLVAEMQEKKEVIIGGTLPQRISSCLRELDGFLLQNSPVVSSMVVAEKKAGPDSATNIVDAVMNVIGLKSLKNISLHTPLSELGMDSVMAVEIKHISEREFGIFLTLKNIRSLNFIEIEKMSQQLAGADGSLATKVTDDTNDLSGSELLIGTLGTEQINAETYVPLVTKTENDETEVFILPGIEGSHTVFGPLAEKLKYPTTCLQFPTAPTDSTSIHDIADFLIPHVRARNKGRKDFTLVGYSFGSMVAIELVRRLEFEGLNGRLVLIDGSPDYLKTLLNQRVDATTNGELQSSLISSVMDIVPPGGSTENYDTWKEKLGAFTKSATGNTKFNSAVEVQETACPSVYCRFKAIQTYDTSALSPLKTPILLLRPRIQTVDSISEDYGLRLLTREKVEVHYVEGNHVTILDDDVCAAAINGELGENLL